MLRPRPVLVRPLISALLGLAFCVWAGLGNDINFCVTAGCTLYQDTSVAGISMWWIGGSVFALLAVLAVVGAGGLRLFCSALALLGDIVLLLLLALTAPCVMCLVAAVFFATTYRGFRLMARSAAALGRPALHSGRSVLIGLWSLLFIVNIGAAVRSQSGVWPMLGDAADASVHLYFSPSCPSCREAVENLSGRVDVAFYPVAEGAADVFKTQNMLEQLDKGLNMAEALAAAQSVAVPDSFWSKIEPDLWLLRLRLLRNKAHIFTSGSDKVPFVEYRGLPASLAKQSRSRPATASSALPQGQGLGATSVQQTDMPPAQSGSQETVPALPSMPLDDKLPAELDPLTTGNCPGNKPCN